MEDVNVSNDSRQLSQGQVKVVEYSLYDINEYHSWTVKLEASSPLAATTNSGVVTSGKDDIVSYPVFMPKPSTHHMHDLGSIVPHI
jgi:hypothetical protein